MTTKNTLDQLIILAKQAASKAYAPYSSFEVGCAIELDDQKVITAFNIENAVLGSTVCAERVALFMSKIQNYPKKSIKRIVIFNDNKKIISPCGTCRQVISELANKETQIIMVNGQNQTRISNIIELLPFYFDNSHFS